jgi:CHAT domain-containing protein
MHSGTPKIMASLWNVSDMTTAWEMALFYTAMEGPGMSPAAALRFAQIKMLEESVGVRHTTGPLFNSMVTGIEPRRCE